MAELGSGRGVVVVRVSRVSPASFFLVSGLFLVGRNSHHNLGEGELQRTIHVHDSHVYDSAEPPRLPD